MANGYWLFAIRYTPCANSVPQYRLFLPNPVLHSADIPTDSWYRALEMGDQSETQATRVLIVDDQADFRRHLRELLTVAGLIVVGEAGDIPEAESLLETLQPDLAVVDVVLPGVNGLDGARRFRTLSPSLRVIVVSAHRDRAEIFRTAAKEAGAEAFISKDDLDLEIARTWAATRTRTN